RPRPGTSGRTAPSGDREPRLSYACPGEKRSFARWAHPGARTDRCLSLLVGQLDRILPDAADDQTLVVHRRLARPDIPDFDHGLDDRLKLLLIQPIVLGRPVAERIEEGQRALGLVLGARRDRGDFGDAVGV